MLARHAAPSDDGKQAVLDMGDWGSAIFKQAAPGSMDAPPADGGGGHWTCFGQHGRRHGFTGLLLADMVRKGEVSLDDPASKYARPGARIPTYQGRPISLRDLVTHTSGLPRMPAV